MTAGPCPDHRGACPVACETRPRPCRSMCRPRWRRAVRPRTSAPGWRPGETPRPGNRSRRCRRSAGHGRARLTVDRPRSASLPGGCLDVALGLAIALGGGVQPFHDLAHVVSQLPDPVVPVAAEMLDL